MSFDNLFNLVDALIGDIATFRGITFNLDHGMFTIDVFGGETEDRVMFLCDFVPHNSTEPVSFAACGVDELREQIALYVLE